MSIFIYLINLPVYLLWQSASF